MIDKTITEADSLLLTGLKGKFLLNDDNRLFKLIDFELTNNTFSGAKLFLKTINIIYCDTAILEINKLTNEYLKSYMTFYKLDNWRKRYLFVQNQYKYFKLELIDYIEPKNTYFNNEEKL